MFNCIENGAGDIGMAYVPLPFVQMDGGPCCGCVSGNRSDVSPVNGGEVPAI